MARFDRRKTYPPPSPKAKIRAVQAIIPNRNSGKTTVKDNLLRPRSQEPLNRAMALGGGYPYAWYTQATRMNPGGVSSQFGSKYEQFDFDLPDQPGSLDPDVFGTAWGVYDARLAFPTSANGTYNCTIDWGDGTTSGPLTAYDDPDFTHNYAQPGSYFVQVKGQFEGFDFGFSVLNRLKLIGIFQWGNAFKINQPVIDPEVLFAGIFDGCLNMQIVDTPDPMPLGNLSTCFRMFTGNQTTLMTKFSIGPGTDFTGVGNFDNFIAQNINLESFDMPAPVGMAPTNLFSFFSNANSLKTVNADFASWDVSGVTNLGAFFANCRSLTTGWEGTQAWQLTACTNISSMFTGCSSIAGAMDFSGMSVPVVGNAASFLNSCSLATGLIPPPLTNACTTISGMFSNTNESSYDLSNCDLSSVTILQSLFINCINLTSVTWPAGFDGAAVTQISNMFDGCSSLASLDLSFAFLSGTLASCSAVFKDCTSLTSLQIGTWNMVNADFDFFGTTDFLLNVPLDVASYDAILDSTTGWVSRPIATLQTLDANLCKYTAGGNAEAGRTLLTNATNQWTINDAGPA